jgi:quinol monooxygenase YgiN
VRNVLARAAAAVHDEPGCSPPSLHESQGRFIVIEKCSDADALQAYDAGPAVTRMAEEVDDYPDGAADIVVAQPVVVGDPGEGKLRP